MNGPNLSFHDTLARIACDERALGGAVKPEPFTYSDSVNAAIKTFLTQHRAR